MFRATSSRDLAAGDGHTHGISVLRPVVVAMAAIQFLTLLFVNVANDATAAVFRVIRSYLSGFTSGPLPGSVLWLCACSGWALMLLHALLAPKLARVPSITTKRPDHADGHSLPTTTCVQRTRAVVNRWHPGVVFALAAQVTTIVVLLIHFATGDFDTFVCQGCVTLSSQTVCFWDKSSMGEAVSCLVLGIVIVGGIGTLRLYLWLVPRRSICGRIAARCDPIAKRLGVDGRMRDIVTFKSLAVMAKIVLLSYTSLAGSQQCVSVVFMFCVVVRRSFRFCLTWGM